MISGKVWLKSKIEAAWSEENCQRREKCSSHFPGIVQLRTRTNTAHATLPRIIVASRLFGVESEWLWPYFLQRVQKMGRRCPFPGQFTCLGMRSQVGNPEIPSSVQQFKKMKEQTLDKSDEADWWRLLGFPAGLDTVWILVAVPCGSPHSVWILVCPEICRQRRVGFQVEAYSHRPRIRIRPKLFKWIAIEMYDNSSAQLGTNPNSWLVWMGPQGRDAHAWRAQCEQARSNVEFARVWEASL